MTVSICIFVWQCNDLPLYSHPASNIPWNGGMSESIVLLKPSQYLGLGPMDGVPLEFMASMRIRTVWCKKCN